MANSEVYNAHLRRLQATSQVLKSYHVSLSELLFLLSFPFNFVSGKIIHWSGPQEEVYNYYNNKNNIFNQIFVKRGWFWTSFVLVVFYVLIFAAKKPYVDRGHGGNHPVLATHTHKWYLIWRSLVRYVLMTVWWVFFTQWCFGLPLMDLIFVYTGGKCAGVGAATVADTNFAHLFTTPVGASVLEATLTLESNRVSSLVCRRLRGNWQGGHDPSGHVFLLTHLSLYLFLEMAPYWNNARIREAWALFRRSRLVPRLVTDFPHILVVSLVALWWFMLLMTNIYFHSLAEKAVGLAFGYLGVAVVYYVPRFRGWRAEKQEK